MKYEINITKLHKANGHIYAEGVGVGAVDALTGGEGVLGVLIGTGTGTGRAGGETGRAGGGTGRASGETGRVGGWTGADALAGGVGAVGTAAKGRALTGVFAPIGADDEVELLDALPSTIATAIGVAEAEGKEELEELFEGTAPGVTEGWISARTRERRSKAD